MNIPDVKYRISNEYLQCKSMRFTNKTEDKVKEVLPLFNIDSEICPDDSFNVPMAYYQSIILIILYF